MDFKQLVIGMTVFSLLIFSAMSFIINIQDQNNADENIKENTLINKTYYDLQGNLSGTQTEGETASGVFGDITPSQQFGELEVTSMVSPTKIFKTMTIGLFNILIGLPMILLGVSPIVASVISAILLLLLIIGIWAVWKGVIK